MNRLLQCLFFGFIMIGLMGSVQAFQSPDPYEPRYNEQYAGRPAADMTTDEVIQNAANESIAEQKALIKENASQAVQLDTNTEDIAQMQRMTGTQDFILKLVAIIMPLLIAMMTGIMLYIQIKQKAAGEQRGFQQREDLILVARSVNGVKTELVAKAELAAFLEGIQIEANGKLSANAEVRLAELREAARYATEQAEKAASKTIAELTAKQNQKKPEIVPMVVGEKKTLEAVNYDQNPANQESIAIHPGEVKSVVGVNS